MTDPSHRALAGALLCLTLPLAATPAPAGAGLTAPDPTPRLAYVMLEADSDVSLMAGTREDLRQARAHRIGRGALLLLRRDGRRYVVRDPVTLRRADTILAPQRALGGRQAALGAQQSALGERQAKLGAEQARIGRLMAAAGPAAPRGSGYDAEQRGLGDRQGALGGEQAALGARQAALGEEQRRVSLVAEGKLRALLDEAIRNGIAQAIP